MSWRICGCVGRFSGGSSGFNGGFIRGIQSWIVGSTRYFDVIHPNEPWHDCVSCEIDIIHTTK